MDIMNFHVYHFSDVYQMWYIAGNQGFGTYRFPGSVYSGTRWVPGWVPPFYYPQCEGSRSWRRHSHTVGVWAWSQEIKVITSNIKFFPSCKFNTVYYANVNECVLVLVFGFRIVKENVPNSKVYFVNVAECVVFLIWWLLFKENYMNICRNSVVNLCVKHVQVSYGLECCTISIGGFSLPQIMRQKALFFLKLEIKS